MSPIRIALIGLSASAKTSWAAEGHLPYLLSPKGSSKYQIVALLNSSEKAAEAARTHYNLPPTVKAYGDPAAVAADPDVDLVVCNTRVDVHFATVEPSLRAGKAVFVEWPLVENYGRAVELTKDLVCDDSIIGLQGRFAPPILKVKELLASGRIGRVLSSDIRAFGSLVGRDSLPDGLAYFAERKVGGSPVTIAYAHMIDYVHDTLGEFESFQSRMQIQRPQIDILRSDGSKAEVKQSDVPDFLAIHGPLGAGGADTVEGATLAATFRSGNGFKGKPAFIWTINGEKGEITLTSPDGPYLMSDSYDTPATIELEDFASEKVIDIPWDWEDWQKELPVRSRIVAQLYEKYAQWVQDGRPKDVPEGYRWPRLHDAVARHKEFNELFAKYDSQKN